MLYPNLNFTIVFGSLLFFVFSPFNLLLAKYDEPVHAFALHGEPKYRPGFKSFDYVNTNAPKGGVLVVHTPGATFDSLNPFILKGTPASGLFRLHQNDTLPAIAPVISESLLISSLDEPFTMYGLIAETLFVPEDKSYVRFSIRKEARFQDGAKITPEDVIFSFETLIEKGDPLYRAYFADVDRALKTQEQEVTFYFKTSGNAELPLILGEMPILSRSYWKDKEIKNSGLTPPLGSGPYRIKRFEPGRFIEYERIKDYWGSGLPVNIGRHNFDLIRFDYYRDQTVAFEAFISGEYDLRYENSARNWSVGYEGDKLRSGQILKRNFRDQTPAGMQAFVYNTRREIFSNKKVRKALAYAFDFSWTNRTIFYDQYQRTRSYFQNSELSAVGLPSDRELDLLEPFRDQLPKDIFKMVYDPPRVDKDNSLRSNLIYSLSLLENSGWSQTPKGLINKDGEIFEFEILLRSPSFERIVGPFIKNLQRLGVNARMRTVDSSQWINRIQAFDFDMIVFSWGQSLSPGNEQRNYWGTTAADMEGSRNFAGIKDPVVDKLIEGLVISNTREELVAHTKAMDRLLQWGYYVIPHWYAPDTRLAFWNKFSFPNATPLKGVSISTWWFDSKKYNNLKNIQGGEINGVSASESNQRNLFLLIVVVVVFTLCIVKLIKNFRSQNK